MEDRWAWMVEERVCECLHGEQRSFPRPHVDAHQSPRKEIDDGSHVDLLPAKDEFREVGCPDVVWI